MRRGTLVIFCLTLSTVLGCAQQAPQSPDLQNPDSQSPDSPDAGALPPDPLAPLGGPPSKLIDVSSDVAALLEHGTLAGACQRMDPNDRDSRLLCGKSMFFYEGFSTAGAPADLIQFLLDNFSAELGPGFEKLGLIADPNSTQHLPLGLTPTVKLGGVANALAFTCASCHVAKLPDGRYAVGAPNGNYQYGRHNLSMVMFPLVALNGSTDGHDATAVAQIQPLLDHYAADPTLKNKLYRALLPVILAGTKVPSFPAAAEGLYAQWKPGTMDFFIEPLPINDGVHIVSKISPLWELPEGDEVRASGMMSAMLGWTGNTPSLTDFCTSFVTFGGGKGADWPAEKLGPLIEYVYSLRRPENPTPPDSAQVALGRKLFASRGCLGCHDGPRGSGKHVYSFDEMGTDRAMERWLDPNLDGKVCCGAPVDMNAGLTHAIKSPRLVGSWTFARFLHNGSVDSLESLFCLSGDRPTRSDEPLGDAGHRQSCDALSDDEKRSLIAYLRAN
jgi:hypothetical protein